MKKLFSLLFVCSMAFTAPLDEIFKDVEVSGNVRYRYEIKQEKKYNTKKQHQNKTRTEITIR